MSFARRDDEATDRDQHHRGRGRQRGRHTTAPSGLVERHRARCDRRIWRDVICRDLLDRRDRCQHRGPEPRGWLERLGRLQRGGDIERIGEFTGGLGIGRQQRVEFGGFVGGEFAERGECDQFVESIVHVAPPIAPLSRCSPPRTRPFTVPSGRPSSFGDRRMAQPFDERQLDDLALIGRQLGQSPPHSLSLDPGDHGIVGERCDLGPALGELLDPVALRLLLADPVDRSATSDRDRPCRHRGLRPDRNGRRASRPLRTLPASPPRTSPDHAAHARPPRTPSVPRRRRSRRRHSGRRAAPAR